MAWDSIGFLVLFLSLWCVGCFLFAHVSGWARLAAHFRTTNAPEGRRLSMQTGWIGMIHYTGCLIVHVAEGGMYLETFPLWRIGHPRLFIPWTEFNNLRQTKRLSLDLVEASIGRPPIVRVLLQPHIFPPELLEPGCH